MQSHEALAVATRLRLHADTRLLPHFRPDHDTRCMTCLHVTSMRLRRAGCFSALHVAPVPLQVASTGLLIALPRESYYRLTGIPAVIVRVSSNHISVALIVRR